MDSVKKLKITQTYSIKGLPKTRCQIKDHKKSDRSMQIHKPVLDFHSFNNETNNR